MIRRALLLYTLLLAPLTFLVNRAEAGVRIDAAGGSATSISWSNVTGKPAGFADDTDDTGGGSSNPTSWAVGQPTGPILMGNNDVRGANHVSASSYSASGAGYSLLTSTQPGQGAGFRTVGSSVNVMASSAVFYLGDVSPTVPSFSVSDTSASFKGKLFNQGVEVASTTSDLVQWTGYDSFGVSSNVINISSATGLHNRVVLAVDASSPTNNVVMKAFVPKFRNMYRDPICRFFEVSNASTTGALVAYEANSQVIQVTIATASPNVVPSTMTFSNPITFTVPGGSAPGAVRRVLDQTLTGWAAVIGQGGVDVYLKFTAANPGVNTIVRNFLAEVFATQ